MSETVQYRGTLTVVERLPNETIGGQCKRMLGERELGEWNGSYQEQLIDENYERYIIHEGTLYSVEKKEVGEDDTFIITDGKDGKLNFEVRYYNGSCSFNEAIEYAFNNKE